MTDEVWRRETVESPCIKLCVVHPDTRHCLGCFRSIDEIAAWGSMRTEERRTVVAELPARAERLRPSRRGGRAARLDGNE